MQTMNPLVVYFSRGGNTRKVADAIAQELGCKSVDIKEETPDLSAVDMLIVGSGHYMGKIDKSLLKFLSNLEPSDEKKAAVFATAASPNPKVVSALQKALEAKAYEVVSIFKCRGQFLFFLNRGRPNKNDLQNAKAFARALLANNACVD